MSDLKADHDAWKARRLAALAAPDGWLNIIGRYPLETGTVSVGSAAGNDIVLPAGPDVVGRLTQGEDGRVVFSPADGGQDLDLPLSKSNPPRFTAGSLLLEVTTLNGENALRVRDTASTAARDLKPLHTFPFDPAWRIVADWVRLDAPVSLGIDTSRNIPTEVEATHKAVFHRDGRHFELLATHGTPERPQFVFRDETARGGETYPAARFLFGENVTETTILLDFNRAVSPPCAFTDFAVCPLPPPANVLPIRVEAGELAPTH
ncbi:DUF1684 domain-containing protein [Antarcticirhabdus aurantiaca]|uniref:DUF1684 domain-containing protein n=1 Tax=Antarcticirhabdus aurantiaca TaxID=2606717 RepID=A0ACD4NMC8_9HYPH|nr:DUF1684 domain-containing protein [Antarcticirhabdus aurantiaca]WAJ27993.1 DUF1684 domain-containing protein [Jeongeuplla avenae]